MAVRFPAFTSSMSVVAIRARISPFFETGAYAVCSVMGPLTLPYMYTLSKKTSLAPARLQASMVLPIIRGHNSRQTLMSYFKPTSRWTTLDPATARITCCASEISAASVSVPAAGLGFRLTSRKGVPLAERIFTSSLLIGPPAPRMVVSAIETPLSIELRLRALG